jgi:hypothetical protein
MSHDVFIYLAGVALGIVLGTPFGYFLRIVIRPVDRWLDVRWRR